jgi:hypothetical protein
VLRRLVVAELNLAGTQPDGIVGAHLATVRKMGLRRYLSMLQFIMTPQRGSPGSFLKMTRHLA